MLGFERLHVCGGQAVIAVFFGLLTHVDDYNLSKQVFQRDFFRRIATFRKMHRCIEVRATMLGRADGV